MIMPKYLHYILFVIIVKESLSVPIDPNLNLDYDDIKYLLEVLDDAEASVSSPIAKVSKIPKASLPQLNSKQSIDELLHLLLQQKDQIDNFELLNGGNDGVINQDVMNVSPNTESNKEGTTEPGFLTDGVTLIPVMNENKGNATIQTNTTMSENISSIAASVSNAKEPQLKVKSNTGKRKEENPLTVVRSGNDELKSSLLTGDAELDKILSEEIAKLADEMASGSFSIQPPSLRKRVNKPIPQTLANVRMPSISPSLSSFPVLTNPPTMHIPTNFLSRQPLTPPINGNNQLSSLLGGIKPLTKPKKSSLSTVGLNGVTRGVCKYISKEGFNVEISFVQQQESEPPKVTKTVPPRLHNPEEHLLECMRLSSKTQTSQFDSINFVRPTKNQDDKGKEQMVSWILPDQQKDQTGILTGFTGFSPLQQPLLNRQDNLPVSHIAQLDKDLTPKVMKLKRISDKMKRNSVLRSRYSSSQMPTLEEAKELKLLVESYIVLLLE